MRSITAVALAASLLASNAYAATVSAPLAPGKPAGVQHAQMNNSNTLFIALGVGIMAAGIALAASGDSNQITSAASTSTSTGTSTSTSTATST